jgi:hypothetical protein
MLTGIVLGLVVGAAFLFMIFGPSEINDETYRKK